MTFGGQTFYSKGDVNLVHSQQWFPVGSSRHGVLDYRSGVTMDTIEFTPDGRFVAAALSTINPWRTKMPGESVFGTDSPLVLYSVDGSRKRTYKAAAVTKAPDLNLTRRETMFGSMQFTCIYGEDAAVTDADALFTDATQSYPGDSGYDPAAILTQVYALAYGATSPFDSFHSQDGVKITFKAAISPEENERKGICDYTFQGLEVSATLKPEGPTPAEVLALLNLQGSGSGMGRSLNAAADDRDLVITGSGFYFSLNKPGLTADKEIFSNRLRRMGEVEFRATRTLTSGALDPLFYIGAAAPA